MFEIVVPQINTNDNVYILKEYFVKEGQMVNKGDRIAAVSSSKSVEDIIGEDSGSIHLLKKEDTEVSVGEVLAVIFASEEERNSFTSSEKQEENQTCSYTLTKVAKQFASEHDFTKEELEKLNKKLIKKTDLEMLLEKRKENLQESIRLSFNQVQVGKTVTKSALEVPKAFQVTKVNCNRVVEKLRELSEELGVAVGLAEILVVILEEISPEFQNFYGTRQGEDKLLINQKPGIGVTFDIGNGLFVPVVKAGDAQSVEEAAEVLLEYKVNAMRGEFLSEQLSGGAISISINAADDVVFVSPIILPGQVCMVSVGSILSELALDETKNIVENKYAYLGLAYDHRIVNGFEATNFLTRIKNKIEEVDFKEYK